MQIHISSWEVLKKNVGMSYVQAFHAIDCLLETGGVKLDSRDHVDKNVK